MGGIKKGKREKDWEQDKGMEEEKNSDGLQDRDGGIKK